MEDDEVYSVGIGPNWNNLRDNDWLRIAFVHDSKILRIERSDGTSIKIIKIVVSHIFVTRCI